MTRFILPAALFFLLVFEGTVFQVFAPDNRGSALELVPRFMFILIMLTGIIRGRSYSLFYGIIFGILYDIVYSPVLGIYTFGFGFFTYLFSISNSYVKRRPSVTALLVTAAVIGLEYYIYGMMLLLGITALPHEAIFTSRLLPSFIMNGLLAAILAVPVRAWFIRMDGADMD
ncbi:rod shape-determining protein MreD [Alkalicoccus luteus]|uniref:rod shape-determining protein MreD n=1 Tax=Alkalicoccus luteus TaxID=1237094 RepID=UPI0040341820